MPLADCLIGDLDGWYDSDILDEQGKAGPPPHLTTGFALAPRADAAQPPQQLCVAPQGGDGLGTRKRRALDDAGPAHSVHRRCA